ncbi:helix-turn-helix domain-containing protein [Clostridium perfringens]|uniref:helix-turn-helix domain-containing protein n=1 Tax=Clostridium perfringens TaxID=1502 RepID=UPI0039E9D457
MKSIADRIKEGLLYRNMKQADLVNLSGISKGALSSYISGSYEPKQKNIYKLAKALNVNEAWLMGYDVPMEREIEISPNFSVDDIEDEELREFMKNYLQLDDETRGYINGLINKALKK